MSAEEKYRVSRYGLHKDESGVSYLQQHNGKGHNFVGYAKPSPFKVVTNTRVMCPHNITVNGGMPDRFHWETFQRLYADPLFQAFLPIPKEPYSNALYLTDSDGRWVTMCVLLSRLCSPVGPIIYPMEKTSAVEIGRMLAVTNVAPLIITNIEQHHQSKLNMLAAEAVGSPRRLILLGDPHLIIRPPMARIKSELDKADMHELLALPLESLGAVALRRYCRGEIVNGNFEKKIVEEIQEISQNTSAPEAPADPV